MKNIMVKINIAAVVIFSLFISTSCNKDNDTEKPAVNITSPYENQMFVQGGQLSIKAGLSDNEELKEYKIDISPVAGLNHKSSLELNGVWDTLFVNTISGTTFQINLQVPIPALANIGDYHVEVICIDKEGNEGSSLQTFKVAYSK